MGGRRVSLGGGRIIKKKMPKLRSATVKSVVLDIKLKPDWLQHKNKKKCKK